MSRPKHRSAQQDEDPIPQGGPSRGSRSSKTPASNSRNRPVPTRNSKTPQVGRQGSNANAPRAPTSYANVLKKAPVKQLVPEDLMVDDEHNMRNKEAGPMAGPPGIYLPPAQEPTQGVSMQDQLKKAFQPVTLPKPKRIDSPVSIKDAPEEEEEEEPAKRTPKKSSPTAEYDEDFGYEAASGDDGSDDDDKQRKRKRQGRDEENEGNPVKKRPHVAQLDVKDAGQADLELQKAAAKNAKLREHLRELEEQNQLSQKTADLQIQEIDSLRKENDDRRRDVSDLSRRNADLEQQLQEANKSIDQLRQTFQDQARQLNQLDSHNKSLEQQLQNAQAQLNQASSTQNELATWRNNAQTLANEKSQLVASNQRLMQDLADAHKKNTANELALLEAKRDVQAEITNLKSQILTQASKIDELNSELSVAKGAMAALSQGNQSKGAELNTLRQTYEGRIDSLNKAIQSMQTELERERKDKQAIQDRLNQVSLEAQRSADQERLLRTQLTASTEQLDGATQILTQTQQQRDNLAQQSTTLLNQAKQLQHDLQQSKQQQEIAEKRAEELQRQLQQQRASNAATAGSGGDDEDDKERKRRDGHAFSTALIRLPQAIGIPKEAKAITDIVKRVVDGENPIHGPNSTAVVLYKPASAPIVADEVTIDKTEMDEIWEYVDKMTHTMLDLINQFRQKDAEIRASLAAEIASLKQSPCIKLASARQKIPSDQRKLIQELCCDRSWGETMALVLGRLYDMRFPLADQVFVILTNIKSYSKDLVEAITGVMGAFKLMKDTIEDAVRNPNSLTNSAIQDTREWQIIKYVKRRAFNDQVIIGDANDLQMQIGWEYLGDRDWERVEPMLQNGTLFPFLMQHRYLARFWRYNMASAEDLLMPMAVAILNTQLKTKQGLAKPLTLESKQEAPRSGTLMAPPSSSAVVKRPVTRESVAGKRTVTYYLFKDSVLPSLDGFLRQVWQAMPNIHMQPVPSPEEADVNIYPRSAGSGRYEWHDIIPDFAAQVRGTKANFLLLERKLAYSDGQQAYPDRTEHIAMYKDVQRRLHANLVTVDYHFEDGVFPVEKSPNNQEALEIMKSAITAIA